MMFQPLIVGAALLSAVAVVSLLWLISPPPARLASRVRPYSVTARTRLGGSAEAPAIEPVAGRWPMGSMIVPLVQAVAARAGRLLENRSEEAMLLRLRQSGLFDHLPEEERLFAYRLRQLLSLAGSVAVAVLLSAVLRLPTVRALAVTALALVVGATRQRGRLDRSIEQRTAVMRVEIYTVNQLLALRVRAGGGVVHAVSQLVARGRGHVVTELGEALRLHRSGMRAAEAFHRIAQLTPEPACARTYALLAAAEERGSDLAAALLDLAEDVREARREAMRRAATKRRAAMLLPIVGILAPVMLLFVGAPLPQLVLNWR